jgi:hypothetical protein
MLELATKGRAEHARGNQEIFNRTSHNRSVIRRNEESANIARIRLISSRRSSGPPKILQGRGLKPHGYVTREDCTAEKELAK